MGDELCKRLGQLPKCPSNCLGGHCLICLGSIRLAGPFFCGHSFSFLSYWPAEARTSRQGIMSDMGVATAWTCVLIILPAHMKPSLKLYGPHSIYGISLQIQGRKLARSLSTPSRVSLLSLSLASLSCLSLSRSLAFFLIRLWSKLLGISLLCPVSRPGKEEQRKKAS